MSIDFTHYELPLINFLQKPIFQKITVELLTPGTIMKRKPDIFPLDYDRKVKDLESQILQIERLHEKFLVWIKVGDEYNIPSQSQLDEIQRRSLAVPHTNKLIISHPFVEILCYGT